MGEAGEYTAAGDIPFNREVQLDGITEKEAGELYKVLKRFMKAYHEKDPECSDLEWLEECYRRELPEWEEEQTARLAGETLSGIREYDRNLESAREAARQGISSEKWLERKLTEAAKGLSINEFGNYLARIDTALADANAQMMRTVTTQAGETSQCMNLDGFIAEQHHVNTFNASAALKKLNYEARVQVPGPGETYGRNSFDTVIVDRTTGKIVQQHQHKCGSTGQETIRLFRRGNYNNQRFVVPADQVEEVQAAFPGKTVTSVIGGEELGASSIPVTKAQVKELQTHVQAGGAMEKIGYDVFQTRDLIGHIGKNAALAGIQAAVVSTGFTLAAKVLSGEDTEPDAVMETAFTAGADSSVKAAATGALKVCSEKGVIAVIPPGMHVHWIASIACVGIENAKILARTAAGELTVTEALDQMGRTSTAMVCGLGAGAIGLGIGAAALSWIPVAGPILGGLLGGMAGYMAGSGIGEAAYSGAKKIGSAAVSAARGLWEGAKSVGRAVASGISSGIRSVAGFFGW